MYFILKKANNKGKIKFCSKCNKKILPKTFYRYYCGGGSCEKRNYCPDCFAFLVSRYSMLDDWKKYTLTEEEKKYLEKHNNDILRLKYSI